MLLGTLFFLSAKWGFYKVQRDGQIVEMKIITLPINCEISRVKYFMDVTYQGVVFTKRIPVGSCYKYKVGELVKVKYLKGQQSVLFPGETVQGDFIALGIFAAVGIFSILFGLFNKRG